MATETLNIRNPKARHDYYIGETFEAGMVLAGTEVKAIRDGKVRLLDAYIDVEGNEVWIKQLWIGQPVNQTRFTHDENRLRKLLLNRSEMAKLRKGIERQGSTVIALRMYENDRGKIKLEVALAEGKSHAGKRDALKEREVKRQLDRVRKGARE